MGRFHDRREAGRKLAQRLAGYAGRDDVVVLGIPRGGVPVAFEIARALNAPLDVFVVLPLNVPENEELAFGTVTTGGVRVVDRELVERIGIPAHLLEAADQLGLRELDRRERALRVDRPPLEVAGQTVVLVDDGTSGRTALIAAVQALRAQRASRVVVAAPVVDAESAGDLRYYSDELVTLETPD